MKQAINFMTQSGATGLMKGTINGIHGRVEQYDVGEIRMNTNNMRYVELTCRRFTSDEDGNNYIRLWQVRDVLTDETYEMRQRNLGSRANEMEVIAWAARL